MGNQIIINSYLEGILEDFVVEGIDRKDVFFYQVTIVHIPGYSILSDPMYRGVAMGVASFYRLGVWVS